MKWLFFFIIFLLLYMPFVKAEKIDDLEVDWGTTETSYILSWSNPSITQDGYTIKILDFNWLGDAGVEVSRNGEKREGLLSTGENTYFNFTTNKTYYQGVRINSVNVSNFYPLPINIGTYPCCPAAEIKVSVAQAIEKNPKMELTLDPDWDGRSGATSVLHIGLNNSGNASFLGGNITIYLGGLVPSVQRELSDYSLQYDPSKGTLTRYFYSFSRNYSYFINLSVKPPKLPLPEDKTRFIIKIDTYFWDDKGNIYPSTASAEVSLNPTVNIDKRISPGTILGDKYFKRENYVGWVGLPQITVISLFVKNMQSYPVNVNLTDTVPDNFYLTKIVHPANATDNNTKLIWNFPLNAGETKELRYEMKAKKMGSYIAPAAVATWQDWGGLVKSTSSNQPQTRVYGVFVIVTKSVEKTDVIIWQKVNVTLNLENIGDFPAGLNVTDILPVNSILIGGTKEFSDYLYPKQSVTLTYTMEPGRVEELELPSPVVTFWKKEFNGSYSLIPPSNITVHEPIVPTPKGTINQTKAPLPTPTATQKGLIVIINENVPWLEGSFPIIMIFVSIIILLALNYIRR